MATGLPDDYEAQQRAAESFQPDLAVRPVYVGT